MSKKPLLKVHINLVFNENLYRLKLGKQPFVPLLVPNLAYKVDVDIENIDPNGASDLIKVFVFNHESTVPLITANLSMPLSEVNLDGF